MNDKERWLRAISCKETDRLIFWPKIFSNAYMKAQKGRFKNMSIKEVHDYAKTDIFFYLNDYLKYDYGKCGYKEYKKGNAFIREYSTPYRDMKAMYEYDKTTSSYHPTKMSITGIEDIKAMKYFFDEIEVSIDEELLTKRKEYYNECGLRGIVVDNIAESPLMDFLEWYAGIENGQYLLVDNKDETEELFESMQKLNVKKAELKNERTPADVLIFTENTSSSFISPKQFNKYCKRHLIEYSDISKKYEKKLLFHMCGHLKAFLSEIDEIDVWGIEAFTTKPVGNVTVKEGKEKLRDKCLIGCTNCNTWIKEADEIIKEIEKSLFELKRYNGIIIGTGGIIPPACSPDTLKKVCEHIFNLKIR